MALTDQINELKRVDAEIAQAKAVALAEVREHMARLGVTVDDLAGRAVSVNGRRPPRYSDGANTWTGIGQRPRWVKAALLAGASLDDFKVK